MSEDTNKEDSIIEESNNNQPEVYIVKVVDTFTGVEKEVEVTEEVFNEFRRGKWRIAKNNKKHADNSVPFSSLNREDGHSVDDFSEMADNTYNPENLIDEDDLKSDVALLNSSEKDLIHALYYEKLSSREYAKRINRSQSWVQKKKFKILKKLKNFIN